MLLRADLVSLESLSGGGSSSLSPPSRDARPGVGYLALVAATGLAVFLLLNPAPEYASYPLPQNALLAVGGGGTTELVRVSLEAYRWTHGSYPSKLSELPPPLAEAEFGQYIYERSASGYTLQRLVP